MPYVPRAQLPSLTAWSFARVLVSTLAASRNINFPNLAKGRGRRFCWCICSFGWSFGWSLGEGCASVYQLEIREVQTSRQGFRFEMRFKGTFLQERCDYLYNSLGTVCIWH